MIAYWSRRGSRKIVSTQWYLSMPLVSQFVTLWQLLTTLCNLRYWYNIQYQICQWAFECKNTIALRLPTPLIKFDFATLSSRKGTRLPKDVGISYVIIIGMNQDTVPSKNLNISLCLQTFVFLNDVVKI